MAKLKLTKTAVETAIARDSDYELRDATVPGFLLKITPAGRKIFMVAYATASGQRRKPAIGRFGELTVEQARSIAQDWLAEVRRGGDPSATRTLARHALTVKELCTKFLEDYSRTRNKPRTVERNESHINGHIVPALGKMKVPDVTRSDIVGLMKKMEATPVNANRTLACLRKMFNLAEVWGYRTDGSNPCRHVPRYPERSKSRLMTDDELKLLYAYLDRAEADGLEHPFLILAIRLQFEFAARMSEILTLEWSWIDMGNLRVVWPDAKAGEMSKPIGPVAKHLLDTAPRLEASPFVCPSIFDPKKPMPKHTYYKGWKRILQRAGIEHMGTHGMRHRATTDIANSGIPVKVGMALTGHKTVTMFMRYVHTEDGPVRDAAELVSARRQAITAERHPSPTSALAAQSQPIPHAASIEAPANPASPRVATGTSIGNYRPFRHRKGPNRTIPKGSKHDLTYQK
jgi:integrase